MGAWVDHYSDYGRGIFKASKWSKSNKLNHYNINKKKLGNLRKFIYFLFRKIFISRYFIRIFNKFLYVFALQNEYEPIGDQALGQVTDLRTRGLFLNLLFE